MHYLQIMEPLLAVRKIQLHNPLFMNAFRKYQVDVAVLLGANRTRAELEMDGVFEFERTLANVIKPF